MKLLTETVNRIDSSASFRSAHPEVMRVGTTWTSKHASSLYGRNSGPSASEIVRSLTRELRQCGHCALATTTLLIKRGKGLMFADRRLHPC